MDAETRRGEDEKCRYIPTWKNKDDEAESGGVQEGISKCRNQHALSRANGKGSGSNEKNQI